VASNARLQVPAAFHTANQARSTTRSLNGKQTSFLNLPLKMRTRHALHHCSTCPGKPSVSTTMSAVSTPSSPAATLRTHSRNRCEIFVSASDGVHGKHAVNSHGLRTRVVIVGPRATALRMQRWTCKCKCKLHREFAIAAQDHNSTTPLPSTTRLHKGPQQSEVSKLCHRGNLTKPLYPRTCRTVTLSATLAIRPHTDGLDLKAPWPGTGLEPGSPDWGVRLLTSFAHRRYYQMYY
jgi:hypothetical protein